MSFFLLKLLKQSTLSSAQFLLKIVSLLNTSRGWIAKIMKRAILLVVLLGIPGRKCEAQTKVDLSSQSKSVDFSTAAFTLPVRTGPSLSVSCRVGELFYKTNAPAGQNLYGCTSTNVWSLQSGGSGGSGGGGGVSSVAGKAGDVSLQYTDLTDFKVQLSAGNAVIGAGCSASLPCTVRFGSKSYLFPNPATISNLTGTGTAGPHTVYIFVRADGILYFGIDGVSVTGAALTGTVLSIGTTNFPSDSYGLAVCSVSNNVMTQCTDLRGTGRDVVAAADSTLQVINNPTTGYQEIAINPSSVATSSGSNDFSGNNKVNLGSQYLSITLGNDSVSGTVQNRFVVINSSGKGALAGTSVVGRVIGVCMSECGSIGNARVATRGQVLLQFDGPTTAGNYIKLSSTTSGKATDAGGSRPTSGQILGYVLSTNSSAGTYSVILEPDVLADLLQGSRNGLFVATLPIEMQNSSGKIGDRVEPALQFASQKDQISDLRLVFSNSKSNGLDLFTQMNNKNCSIKQQSNGCNQNISSEDFYAHIGSVTISE